VDNGLQTYLLNHIDSLRSVIWQTQTENFRKWRINQEVYSWAKRAYYNNYDSYINDLKGFVNIHIPYLQQAFAQRLTTGIEGVETESANRQFFDLQGRRVTTPIRKGIYINNHHKVIKQ
jgi:hypothetical protein